jgi:hypothetical protein
VKINEFFNDPKIEHRLLGKEKISRGWREREGQGMAIGRTKIMIACYMHERKCHSETH